MNYVIETAYGMRIIEARSIRSAEKQGRIEAGTDNFKRARRATDEDIVWYLAMSGQLEEKK